MQQQHSQQSAPAQQWWIVGLHKSGVRTAHAAWCIMMQRLLHTIAVTAADARLSLPIAGFPAMSAQYCSSSSGLSISCKLVAAA
jgi:hypothetical protein